MNPGNKLLRVARSLGQTFQRLRQDKKAVAATEFALILPFMFLLLIGMAEITGAMNQDRKVSRIASAVTDLVAQAQTVSTSELSAVMKLGEKILAPYPTTDLVTIISSVSFDKDGKASVDWSYDSNGSKPWAKGAKPPITIPDEVAKPNTSIVVGNVTLNYKPPFSGVFTDYFTRDSEIQLGDTYYLRPRLTNTVSCTGC
jgi:Flp pilus assembly protein TadG